MVVKTFAEIAIMEQLRLMSDTKIDNYVKQNWGKASTFPFNAKAVMAIAKVTSDVLLTRDNEYFHIASKEVSSVSDILKQYSLEEIK